MCAPQVLLFGKLVMFVLWGIALAWAFWSGLNVLIRTMQMVELERSKASSAMKARVMALVEKHDRDEDNTLSNAELMRWV